MIDKAELETLGKLEKYLLGSHERELIVADRLSNLVGVLIDIKPACIIDFRKNDFLKFDSKKFEDYLKKLGLVFKAEETLVEVKGGEDFKVNTYFISKKQETLNMIVDAEHELYDLFDENEPNAPVIKMEHRKIGRLLGYPETAIEYFLVRCEKMDLGEISMEEAMKDVNKYHHFIHSRTNGEEEYEEYDRPIHEAMEKYLPTSAEIMRKNSREKRWL